MSGALYQSSIFTSGFTSGIEGPGCDREGNLYAVNYQRQGTIGKVTPEGECSVFAELPDDSIGNGIRFHSAGTSPSNIAFGGPDGCTCYTTLQDTGNVECFRVEGPGRSWQLYQ
jgi:sugar lactone lactonase YvrE